MLNLNTWYYSNENSCVVANGQTRSEYKVRLAYKITSQSIANNTSVVLSRLQVRSTSSTYATYGYNQTTTIQGHTLSAQSFDMRSTNTWQNFGDKELTFTHDADGSKTKTLTASFTTTATSGYSLKSGSVSVEVEFPKIARYATANQSLKSKTSSSITMNWASDSTIDYIWYSSNNGSSWTGLDVTDGTSGSYTISSLSANTTYNIKTRVRRKDSQLTTDSSALSVTTHAKTVPTISLSSRTSSSITVTSSCNVSVSSTQYRIKTSSGSYGSYQTSATFSGLAANTTYVIEVKKVGSASGEAGTATVTVTTHQKTIPTISLSSKTVNSITVSSGCNVTVSSTQYRIKTSSGSYGSYQTSATFSGLSPNTTYVIEVKKVGTSSGENGTATLNVTTYQIATISSAPSFNLGDSQTITYSNPGGNVVTTLQACISFTGELDDISYRDISKTGTSYTFNFTDAELDKLYKKFGTSNSFKATSFVRTICNGVTYHSTKDITITLTGNQKTAHIGVGGVQKRAKVYLGVNGTVKKAVIWIGNNGRKRCI